MVIILTGPRSVGAKPALSPNRTVSAVGAERRRAGLRERTAPYLPNSFVVCEFIFVLEASLGPPIRTQSLINVKSLHTGCQKAVGGAADEAAPTLVALLGDVLSLSVTHTPQRSQSSSHRAGGDVGILVCVCVYIPVGD